MRVLEWSKLAIQIGTMDDAETVWTSRLNNEFWGVHKAQKIKHHAFLGSKQMRWVSYNERKKEKKMLYTLVLKNIWVHRDNVSVKMKLQVDTFTRVIWKFYELDWVKLHIYNYHYQVPECTK